MTTCFRPLTGIQFRNITQHEETVEAANLLVSVPLRGFSLETSHYVKAFIRDKKLGFPSPYGDSV